MVHRVKLGVVAFALALAAAPSAFAAGASSCGLAPFAPALPDAAAITQMAPRDAEAAKHQAFEDIVSWQKGLKTYRGCLDTLTNTDNRSITLKQSGGGKDSQDEIKDLQSDLAKVNAAYNSSVDSEKSVVGGYDAMSNAYCSRRDVDLSSCQQKK